MLQSLEWQRVRHDGATELNKLLYFFKCIFQWLKQMYSVCLIGHKWAVLVSLKFNLSHVISQNDFPRPQYVKISSTFPT